LATLKGKFTPKNPHKYLGDPRGIIHRSSWERICMNYFDLNEDVQKWGSEEKSIRYYDPIAKKHRRYFPDFIVKYKNKHGEEIIELIEVKPYAQVIGPPENPKRKTKAWAKAVQTYMTNMAKWEAAKEFCEENGFRWRIITEKELGIKR
jgi:hypothetical protein